MLSLSRFRDLSRAQWLRIAGWAVVGLLILGAIGLATVPFAAKAAKSQATAATQAIRTQDLPAAEKHSTRAGLLSGYAELAANWWGGDLWSLLPVFGSAVDDAQHLTSSLDDLTHVLGVGVDVLPRVSGDDATLVGEQGTIDIETLEEVLDETRDLPTVIEHAVDELDSVEATAPFVGDLIGSQRDAALSQVGPVAEGLQAAEPLWKHLPDMLGASEPKDYLIAFLNPAEQHLSGGTALSFAPMSFDQGKLERQPPLNAASHQQAFRPLRWQKVHGNPFHRPGKAYRLTHSTTPPSWSVAGNELARAWRVARRQVLDGVVVVDVVALQRLVAVSGPVEAPGYGTLTGSNLTERLIGSYDELTTVEEFSERNKGESVLMSTFQGRLLDGNNMPAKVRALVEAAKGRHFATFFADDELQDAFAGMGFAGDLSDTGHDYLGVFNQASIGHKADYWQRRTVSADVVLEADGSAHVTQQVEVFNDAPPPATNVLPSFANYVRRDNQMLLTSFLPLGAEVTAWAIDGTTVDKPVRTFRDRPFVAAQLVLLPGQTQTMTIEYDVPQAAVVDGDGLVYRLDADPQGMVDPEALEVTVHWPDGFAAEALPTGWKQMQGAASFSTPDFDEISRWEISASRG